MCTSGQALLVLPSLPERRGRGKRHLRAVAVNIDEAPRLSIASSHATLTSGVRRDFAQFRFGDKSASHPLKLLFTADTRKCDGVKRCSLNLFPTKVLRNPCGTTSVERGEEIGAGAYLSLASSCPLLCNLISPVRFEKVVTGWRFRVPRSHPKISSTWTRPLPLRMG